jgi:hypothetical protein
MNFTSSSLCTWIDHSVSGLQQTTSRAVHTRFPCDCEVLLLNLAACHNSLARSTKSTRSCSRTSTACEHGGSGSVSLPAWGSFHLSLSVLVRYRSLGVFSLGRWASPLPNGLLVSGGTCSKAKGLCFRLRGSHALWLRFPAN